ncbi:hypothetical protein GGX14DRAFT_405896 [Mycena pura]|uniref:Uncharacterized protein n=1 Tax=Mycena pura TaxID=153505 RepID=A0AAD6URE7_9AGAR|nr:hypothetical protein GGX14DRAFT_405896 [Mycena pura]
MLSALVLAARIAGCISSVTALPKTHFARFSPLCIVHTLALQQCHHTPGSGAAAPQRGVCPAALACVAVAMVFMGLIWREPFTGVYALSCPVQSREVACDFHPPDTTGFGHISHPGRFARDAATIHASHTFKERTSQLYKALARTHHLGGQGIVARKLPAVVLDNAQRLHGGYGRDMPSFKTTLIPESLQESRSTCSHKLSGGSSAVNMTHAEPVVQPGPICVSAAHHI